MVPSFFPMAMFRPSVAVEHHYPVPPHQKLRAPVRFWAVFYPRSLGVVEVGGSKVRCRRYSEQLYCQTLKQALAAATLKGRGRLAESNQTSPYGRIHISRRCNFV